MATSNPHRYCACYQRYWRQATGTERWMELDLYNELSRQIAGLGPASYAEIRFAIALETVYKEA